MLKNTFFKAYLMHILVGTGAPMWKGDIHNQSSLTIETQVDEKNFVGA